MHGSADRTLCRASWMALLVALTLASATQAKAFEATEEQKEACTPDAFRLCSSEIPDASRVEACMRAKEASLSPRCRAVFEASNPPPAQPAARERVAETPVPRHHIHQQNRVVASNPKHHHHEQREHFLASGDDSSYPVEPETRHRVHRKHWSNPDVNADADPGYDLSQACENPDVPPDACATPDDRYGPPPYPPYFGPPEAADGLYGPVPYLGPGGYPESYIVIDPREDPAPGWHW